MKILKLKSDIPQKVGKVVIWVLIVFLLLRGIGTLFKPSETKTAKDVIAEYTKENEQKKVYELEASAVAQGFVKEYLTYGSNSQDDYTNRIKRYLANYVEITQGFTNDTKAEALNTDVTAVKWMSGTQLNIDIRAKIKYTQKDKITTSDCFIRVPVAIQDGKFAVEDIPAFIPDSEKAAIKQNTFSGKEVDEAQAKEVAQTCENFFKTYYSGNGSEISYYLSDSKTQIKGLDKRFEFIKLVDINAYQDKDTSEIIAIVSLTVKDSINGQQMTQKYNVRLIKKDKLYIENFDVRTVNLN